MPDDKEKQSPIFIAENVTNVADFIYQLNETGLSAEEFVEAYQTQQGLDMQTAEHSAAKTDGDGITVTVDKDGTKAGARIEIDKDGGIKSLEYTSMPTKEQMADDARALILNYKNHPSFDGKNYYCSTNSPEWASIAYQAAKREGVEPHITFMPNKGYDHDPKHWDSDGNYIPSTADLAAVKDVDEIDEHKHDEIVDRNQALKGQFKTVIDDAKTPDENAEPDAEASDTPSP